MSEKTKIPYKLVRDKIPEIIESEGFIVCSEKLQDKDYEFALFKKIVEETEELKEAKTSKEKLEELSDLYEVILALSKYFGFSVEDVEKSAEDKRNIKGGFDNQIYLRYYEK